MQEHTFEVYKLTNRVNNKTYIGCTTEGAGRRFDRHVARAEAGSSYPFHIAITQFGRDVFKIEILELCSSLEEMNMREVYYIALFNATNPDFGYNRRAGGGVRFQSDETKAKIGEIHRDKISEKRKPILQYSSDGEFMQEYVSLTDAGNQNGVTRQSILRSINKLVLKPTTKNPYIWIYKDLDKIVSAMVNPADHFKDLNYVRVMSNKCLAGRKKYLVTDGNIIALSKCVALYDTLGNEITRYQSMSEAAKSQNISVRTIKNHIENSTGDWKFVEDLRSAEELKSAGLEQSRKAARAQGISVTRVDPNTDTLVEFDTIKDAAESVRGDRKALRLAIDKDGFWKNYLWHYKENNTQQEAA